MTHLSPIAGTRAPFEGGKIWHWFNALVERGVLPDTLPAMFDEANLTRNAFAHSIMDVEEITYRGIPLARCFGEMMYGGHLDHELFPNSKTEGVFAYDMEQLTNLLIDKFVPRQFDQLDKRKLFELCDRAMQKRKLIP
jgi:hypothetical protein